MGNTVSIIEQPGNSISIVEYYNTVNLNPGAPVTISVIAAGVRGPAGPSGGINISAGTSSQNSGVVTFANSNGVSFGLNNGVMTASAAGGGGGVALSAPGGSISSGTIVFSNSNGVSFGLNGSTLTGSHNGLTTAMQSQMTSNYMSTSERGNYFDTAGNTFANSTHSHGNPTLNLTNLSGTTASNSAGFTLSLSAAAGGGGADGYNILAAGTQTATTAGSVKFENSNGISFGMSGSTRITASYTVPTIPGATSFSNSNGITFGLNASTITASHNGLTTAAQSNHSHGNPQLNLTNINGTTASNSNGLTLSLSAVVPGATSFSNLNGITFGLNVSTITASHNGLTTAAVSNHSHGFSASGGSSAFQTLNFANSNGITFSNSNGSVIASHNGLTTAMQSQMTSNYMSTSERGNYFGTAGNTFANSTHSHGNPQLNLTNLSGTTASNSAGFTISLSAGAGGVGDGYNILAAGTQTATTAGTIKFENSNGISFGMSDSTRITASYTVPTIPGATSFSNLNGITFGLNGSTITASHNGLTTAAQSNHSHGNPTLNLTNISGTTASNSAGLTLSLSAAAGGGVTPAVSGTNGSFSFSTLTFAQLNGATFYTTNGSLALSYYDAGAGAGISAVVISAGTTNTNISNFSFANSNGVSFGIDGSTITASAAGGGAAGTLSTFVPFFPASTQSQTLGAMGVTSASARYFPIWISENIAFNELRIVGNLSYATSSVSGQQSITSHFGLFSNNAGTLSVISSSSFSLAVTNSSVSATISYPNGTGTTGYAYDTTSGSTTAQLQSLVGTAAGGRVIGLQFGNSMSFAPGMYWLGIHQRLSSSSANVGISCAIGGNVVPNMVNVAGIGQISSALTTATSIRQPFIGFGAYTSTGSAGYGGSKLPDSAFISGIAHNVTVFPLMTFIST